MLTLAVCRTSITYEPSILFFFQYIFINNIITKTLFQIVQVHQDISRSVSVLFINGVEKVIDFGHELQTTGVLVRNSSRGNYPRVVLAFICGITVYVENAAVLQMAVTVPVEFKGILNDKKLRCDES